jgi:hypothetical protein
MKKEEMTAQEKIELLEKRIAELSTKKEKKEKAEKVYSLSIGTYPDKNQKSLGLHCCIITKAITNILEVKNTATKNEIMAEAEKIGLYLEKPSIQTTAAIFSWWRKDLKNYNWISY